MRKYFYLFLILFVIPIKANSQTQTIPYSAGVGVVGFSTASVLFDYLSTCQTTVTLDASAGIWNGVVWSSGSFNLYVNGGFVATYPSPQTGIDLTAYIPITSIQLTSNASTWHTVGGTVYVTSNSASAPPAPGVSNVYYCQGDASAPLTATLTGTGTSLKWYSDANGSGYSTTAPTPSTAAVGTTSYWVAQADAGGCESVRSQIVVTVSAPPADQSVSASQSTMLCSGSTAINLGSSQTGVYYYLRDNATNTIVDGPIQGTGSTLSLNTGTVNTTTTYNVLAQSGNPISSALDFDGVNEYVDLGNDASLDITADITVECLVKVDNNQPDWVRLIGKGDVSNRSYGLWINSTGQLLWQMWGPTNMDVFGPVLTPGQWYHVAAGRSGNTCYMYVNGVLVGTTTYTSTPYTTTNSATIGSAVVMHDYLDGQMDEVRIWNVGRTQAEIQANMCGLTGNETGLVAYYSMSGVSGDAVLVDMTTNANNGTMTNMEPTLDWVSGSDYCIGCAGLQLTQTATVTINSIADQSVAITDATLCPVNTGTTVTTGTSENGVNYYLRDNANDTIVDGPTSGTGSGLTFNTGALSSSMTYNVFAEVPNNNHALNFDGSGDYIVLPNESSFDFTTQMTVEFMVQTTNLELVDGLVTKGDNSWRVHGNGAGGVMFAGNGAFVDFNSTSAVDDGNWHHVAVTYDGVNAKIYIDGVLENSSPATAAINNSTYSVAIGENLQATGRYFEGGMDEVRIWSIARTADEIYNNKDKSLSGTETGLVAYYQFNQGEAGGNNAAVNTLTDATANGNDGTLTGFALNGATSNWVQVGASTLCTQEMATTVSVSVLDITAPVPDAGSLSDLTDECSVSAPVSPTATDDCSGAITGTPDVTFPITTQGTTVVTWTFNDGNGNTSTQTQNVIINDVTAPTITAPADVNTSANDVSCSASGVALGSPVTADNCTVSSVTNDAPASFPEGTTVVTWTVTDGNGNMSTTTQNVTVTSGINLATTQTDVDCNGNSTGTIDLTATGGTTAYSFDWDNDGTGDNDDTEDLSGLAAGTYNVTLTDANGCQGTTSVTINEPTTLVVTLNTLTDPTTCGGTDGAVDVDVAGGTPGYTFDWDNDGTGDNDDNEDLSGIAAGSYELIVTDANGCNETIIVSLSDPGAPVITIDLVTDVLCNGETTGSIDVTVTGGTMPFSYDWDNDGTGDNDDNEDLSGVGAGSYSITVTDAGGCTSSSSATINEPTAIALSATTTDELFGNDGTIDLTVTGGTSPYTYSWTSGDTSEDVSGLAGGLYTATVTDANGCVETLDVTVNSQVSVDETEIFTFVLYPNPNQGQFTVEFINGSDQKIVDIYSASGQLVYSQMIVDVIVNIDLSEVEDGLYMVVITTDEGKTQKRFVKQ